MLKQKIGNFPKVIAISLALTMFANPANAGVKSGLDAMWNITSASTDGVGGYGGTLGGISARVPTKSFSLVAYDAPRIQAGCGGIDLYLGSFSMIDGSQIKGMLQAIMANASGYAFKLALDALCPKCQSILSGLQDIMNKIGSANTNSCELATNFVDAIKDRSANPLVGTGSYYERLKAAAKGASTDFNKAMEKTFKEGKNANRDQNAADESTDYGNSLVNTLVSTGYIGTSSDTSKVPYDVFGTAKDYVGVLMSLYGTSVKLTGANAQSNGKSGFKDTTAPKSKDDKNFDAIWTFRDFVEGNRNSGTLVQYTCDFSNGKADSCQNVSQTSSRWKGFERYVAKMLAGDSAIKGDSVTITKYSDDSILASLADNEFLGKLTPERKRFLASVSQQHKAILSKSAECGSLTETANSMVNLIAKQTAAEMVITLNKAVRDSHNAGQVSGIGGPKKIVPLTDSQQKALDALEAEAKKYTDDNLAQLKVISDSICQVRKAANIR